MNKYIISSLVAFILLVANTAQASEVGYSVDFPKSTTQALVIADSNQVGLDFTESFTFEAWIKVRSQPVADSALVILSKHKNDTQEGYEFTYRNSAGVKQLWLRVSKDLRGRDPDALLVNQELENEKWYHVAVTGDLSAKTYKFYLDGIQIGGNQYGSSVSVYTDNVGLIPF